MDEENIIMALFAKQEGVKKIVAKVNEDTRAQMVEELGIDTYCVCKKRDSRCNHELCQSAK